MTPRSFILRETVISSLFSGVISAIFYWLIFQGQTAPSVWGPRGLVIDSIPQGGMIGLMTVLIPSILALKAIKSGKLQPGSAPAPSPRGLALRALLGAFVGIGVLTGGAAVMGVLTGLQSVGFTTGLTLKVVAGLLLPWLLTPIALRAVLSAPSQGAVDLRKAGR